LIGFFNLKLPLLYVHYMKSTLF